MCRTTCQRSGEACDAASAVWATQTTTNVIRNCAIELRGGSSSVPLLTCGGGKWNTLERADVHKVSDGESEDGCKADEEHLRRDTEHT